MRWGVARNALITLAAIALVAAATSAKEDGSRSPTLPFVAPDATDLQKAIDLLPDPLGESDAQRLGSLLGHPDAFTIAFEPAADWTTSRREQWFYYDLSTVFEFVDGELLWNLPLDAETDVLLNASRYDPAAFEDWMTWRNLASRLPDPFSFEKVELDGEYRVPATVYVGDQIVLAFDEDGEIFYVETVPLAPAVDP